MNKLSKRPPIVENCDVPCYESIHGFLEHIRWDVYKADMSESRRQRILSGLNWIDNHSARLEELIERHKEEIEDLKHDIYRLIDENNEN